MGFRQGLRFSYVTLCHGPQRSELDRAWPCSQVPQLERGDYTIGGLSAALFLSGEFSRTARRRKLQLRSRSIRPPSHTSPFLRGSVERGCRSSSPSSWGSSAPGRWSASTRSAIATSPASRRSTESVSQP